MREKFVGTKLGQILLASRRWWEFRGIPLSNPEKACMIANAILADKLIQRLCPPNGTFLDIGAHIGSVLSSVHQFDRTIKILAVEADPEKARKIREKFPFCSLFDVAVGESPGFADFFVNPSATGYNTLVPGQNGNQSTVRVQIACLDKLLPETHVDLIKIDIEGAELGALKGGELLIKRSKPIIMFESCGVETNALGYSAKLLWQWFDGLGYVTMTPDRLAHDAPSLTLEAFLDAHHYPFRSLNFFAVHRDHLAEVRNRARQILDIRSA